MPPKSKPATSHSSQPAESAAAAEELKAKAPAAGSKFKPVPNAGPTRKPDSAHSAPADPKQQGPSPAPKDSHSSKPAESTK